MRTIHLFFIFLSAFVFNAQTIFANNNSIKLDGVVVYESTNERVGFATIVWLEAMKVFETNEEGEATLEFESDKDITLVASFVGATKDTIIVRKDGDLLHTNNEIIFRLKETGELDDVTIVGEQEANYLSKMTAVRTEVISAAGLCKMACCNLAESFENSASVSVGFSDAITGARQIRLLGLSGSYTQMLDETRPIMRGLASPFGLSYIPGQWLESIQIAKGPSSVVNGAEAITGQINLEHRKPTADNPLFLNLFLSNHLRSEVNIASSIPIGNKWSTVIMGHASIDSKGHDGNGDRFMDEPKTSQFNIDNRWLYMASNGTQLRFGIKALSDDRIGGSVDYNKGLFGKENDNSNHSGSHNDEYNSSEIWGSHIKNSGISSYFKLGVPLNEDNSKSIAFIGDYSYYDTESIFGIKAFNGYQNIALFNAMYQQAVDDKNKFVVGASWHYDDINELLLDQIDLNFGNDEPGIFDADDKYINFSQTHRKSKKIGAYGEYTYINGEKLSIVTGLRLDYDFEYGWIVIPRANIKYSITPNSVLRGTAGRGYRTPNVIADNMGILSTGRRIDIQEQIMPEDAWTYGGNFTQYFKLGYDEDAYVSFDYFRTSFNNQMIVDWDLNYDENVNSVANAVSIYNSNGASFTDTYQFDFSVEPIERLTSIITFRYTNAKVYMDEQGLIDRPLSSKFKGVFNVQYATRMSKWVFDATAQINGPSPLPQFMGGGESPTYPMFYAQITRKFRGFEVYIGGENLLDYKQPNPILSVEDPYSTNFNAAMIWGPLMGRKFYIGMRMTLWR